MSKQTMNFEPEKRGRIGLRRMVVAMVVRVSVATAIAGVFANFTNKIGILTEKLEDVDKAKS